jgi:hypothetical protein
VSELPDDHPRIEAGRGRQERSLERRRSGILQSGPGANHEGEAHHGARQGRQGMGLGDQPRLQEGLSASPHNNGDQHQFRRKRAGAARKITLKKRCGCDVRSRPRPFACGFDIAQIDAVVSCYPTNNYRIRNK